MSNPQISALLLERASHVGHGREERVAQIDEELAALGYSHMARTPAEKSVQGAPENSSKPGGETT